MTMRPTIAIAAVLLLGISVHADWPQFLGPERNGAYRGAPSSPPFPPAARGRLEEEDRAGTERPGGRRHPRHPVPSDRAIARSSSRSTRRRGTTRVAERLSDRLPRRLRLRRGPARGAGCCRRGRLYVRRRGTAAVRTASIGGERAVVASKTATEFDVPKGFFGAAGSPLVEGGRVMANIGGAKAGIIAFDARKGSHRVDRHRRCRELFVAGRRDNRAASATRCSSRATDWSASTRRVARSSSSAPGGPAPTPRSTPRRQWSSTT